MATAVEIPKLGNTVEECLIAKWRKQKGERVSAGEIVAEIETDKATFELTAPLDGILLDTFFEEGTLVPVFTNLFVIGEPGESVDAFRPKSATPAQTAAPKQSAAESAPAEPERGTAITSTAPSASSGAFSPRARRFAEERGFHPAAVSGSGPAGRVLEDDLRKQYYTSARPSSAAQRRIEAGEEARGDGSGAAGLILTGDLGPKATRISGIREKIARRMRESLAGTAQYTLNASANAAGLLSVRAKVKASKGGPDININDLVTFCTVKALMEVPELNAEFIDGKIQKHAEIHIGFACDTPRGLMVPVVRDAHLLPVGELSLKMKDLSARAVAGSIAVDDLSGATFTLSNLGNFGIESFTPLLNPPQVAILGVDGIQVKPVRRDGKIEFIDSIGLSLTLDHQVIDGAPGARFLRVVREKIENVESLCTI